MHSKNQLFRANSMWKFLALFSVIFAGEMIFSLPFHIPRFFRPTVLSVFEISNTDLGDMFAAYGLTAMIAYFPGGILADRYSERLLMCFALVLTALGGMFMLGIPSGASLVWLFGFWGITTILFFWSSMIKFIKRIGGDSKQGSSFGLLDAGRGLLAAGAATVAAVLLGMGLSEIRLDTTDEERAIALQSVILFYTLLCLLAALFVWVFLSKFRANDESMTSSQPRSLASFLANAKRILFSKIFLLKAGVIVCGYCGFKGVDYYALYAVDALSMDEVEAARFTSNIAYIRPVVALIAGYLADKIMSSKVIVYSFVLLGCSYAALAYLNPETTTSVVLMANIVVTVVCVFAIRAVYFALLHESGLSNSQTGTAVGIISVIGFTPDLFFAPIAGRILDASPGVDGLQNLFLLLAFIAVVGLLAVICFRSQLGHVDTVKNT